MPFHEKVSERRELLRESKDPRSPFGGYPERQGTFAGKDIYVVSHGESWGSIANSIYGNESYRTALQKSNPKLTILQPGMRLVLPDRKEDPRVPVPNQNFWNSAEFAQEINAMDDQRNLIGEHRRAETIWPEHGDVVYIGYDENNDPYPTTDKQGMPLWWDPITKEPSVEDTGIRYTMGMVENDFIKPLSPEDQQELTLLGEQRFNPEALAYYAQAGQSEDFHQAITEKLPENSVWIPTLAGERQSIPTELKGWESAIDALSAGEEVARGGANVATREAEERPGLNYFELGLRRVVSVAQIVGATIVSDWAKVRQNVAETFGKDGLKPVAIDPYTQERLSPAEEKSRRLRGGESNISYVSPIDNSTKQLDLATASSIRWFATAFDGHIGGVYPDQFDSEEAYETYIGGLFGVYDENLPEAARDAVEKRLMTEQRDVETRLEASAKRDEIYTVAWEHVSAGNAEFALKLMEEGLRLENRSAHWYSPYYMWSEQTEPWRYDRFIKAAAMMTIENGELLEPRVIRDLRRRYEHGGVDLFMGITLDLFNMLEVFKVGGLVLKQARRFAELIASVKIVDRVKGVRVIGDVVRGMDWLVSESHGAAGTQLKRIANNTFVAVAQSVDTTVSQPGIVGLDEAIEQIVRTADPKLSPMFQGLPEGLTELHLRNVRRLINVFDPESTLSSVQKINPERAGEWVTDAFDIVWNREYRRALDSMASANPKWGHRKVQAEAARHADLIASKPKLAAREMGNRFEEAYRAVHQSPVGPSTLDDNFFIALSRQVGVDDAFNAQGIKLGFKAFYGLRNILFPMWLSLRPAWTVINVVDSTVRSLISGAGLFDDIGTLWRVNSRRLLNSRNLLQEEFTTAFSRGLREVDETTIALEPAIDRILRGHDFKWGFLSFINAARKESAIERKLARQAKVPTTSVGNVVRWVADQTKSAGSMITRGFIDVNSGVEFGLRERVFAKHFRKSFGAMDAYNLDIMLRKMKAEGVDDDTLSVFEKLWALSNDDSEKFADLVEAMTGARRGSEARTTSEILPDNFNDLLDTHGVDRRLRPLVIRPVLDEVELIIRTQPDVKKAASEVEHYLNRVKDLLENEFVEHAKVYASDFDSAAEEIASAVRTVDSSGATKKVNLGAGGTDEILTVTTQQINVGAADKEYLSAAYNARGEAQQISTAQLGDARRQLKTDLADGTIDTGKFQELDLFLSDTDTQVRLFRDRIKQYFLHMYPGPLKLDAGFQRERAWDAFDRLGVRVYDTVIAHTDEAVQLASTGKTADVPTLSTLLADAGIEIKLVGANIGSIRITDDVMGTVTSFGGWRSSNYWRKKLLEALVGPNARLRDADIYFSQPYTSDISNLLGPVTREERAVEMADAFGDAVGKATDDAIKNSDAGWHAVINDVDLGGGVSLRRQWGTEVTRSRQGFIEFLEREIGRLEGLNTNTNTISIIRQLQDETKSIGITLDILTNPLGVVELPEIARVIPKWMLEDGLQTWLNMQRGLVAEHSGLVRFFDEWKDFVVKGLRSGDVNLSRLDAQQIKTMQGFTDEAIARKNTSALISVVGSKEVRNATPELLIDAAHGSKFKTTLDEWKPFVEDMAKAGTGDKLYPGGVSITQGDMLEYAKNSRLDASIKFFSPFWMFQSRSPVFWLKQYITHPEILAWHGRYMRAARSEHIKDGVVDSSGRPLNRFYGYVRVPGTGMYVAPFNQLSMRYVTPRPVPYPSEFGDDISAADIAIQRVYEYGNMFGFRPAPWITYPLYWAGALDQNRLPAGDLVMQTSLIPPWIQRDIRRGLRMERYPNDPGLFSPDVSWKDYLIEKEMLGVALQEIQDDPDSLPRIQAELYEALGYVGTEINEFGVAEDYSPVENLPYREHVRWVAARDRMEKSTYYSQLVGYFTGVYAKEFTDAEAELMAIRDEINFMKDSINSLTVAPVFGLDPVAESRYEMYSNKRWETPEGFVSQLYGVSRWTRLDSGGQAYGDDRRDIIAQRIWENEVSAAYQDSLTILQDEFDNCQKSRKVGAASALNRACWSTMFQGRKFLDDNPVYDLARRDWAIGYKTESMIKDRFEHLWWSYIKSTRPKWFKEDGEKYESWQERTEEWKDNLEDVGTTLVPFFSAEEISSRTGFEGGDDREIPGSRILVEESVLQGLVAQTNREGFETYTKTTDSSFDAMNEAWKVLRWDPYFKMMEGVDEANSYERELAERAFLDKYGDAPSQDELKRWVMENYEEDQFTPEELDAVFGAGTATIEERQMPSSERGVVEDGIWEVLGGIGPGENFQIFKENFVKLGGDDDMFTAWYETNGHIGDFEKVGEFYTTLQAAAQAGDFGIPSEDQLVEFAMAKNMNDEFRSGVEREIGEQIWQTLSVYGVLKGPQKREYKKANAEVLDLYFDMRDFFAEANQLWAKYYNPSEYAIQTGIPGEGVERRGPASGGTGGGGKSRKASFNRSSGAPPSRAADSPFQAQGYRSTYDISRLYDPKTLGSGGIGGRPMWPAGWSKGKPKQILNEVVNLVGKEKPLSEPAVTYLENQTTYKEYIKELLDFNEKVGSGGGGGVVKL